MVKYHYVYRITNIIHKMHYYGTRSSSVEPNMDLGIKYFSSSRNSDFIRDQKANKQNYKYKIVGVFETRNKAISLEIRLHSRFNVKKNSSFYNMSNQTATGFDAIGKKLSKEHIEKLKRVNAGNQHNKGRKHSAEVTAKKASHGADNGMYGKKHTSETLRLISTNITKSKIIKCICEYCKTPASKGNYSRWHSDNCKHNPNITAEQLKKREPWNKMKI